jgi:Ca2+-binding RTX toxin-like protein
MAQIAKVLAVSGKAQAHAGDGSWRELKAGDTIDPGEVVRTATAARVELLMADGQVQSLMSGDSLWLESTSTPAEALPAEMVADTQAFSPAAVIQALQQGVDLTQALAPTEAGAGPAGGGEGNRFVRLLRVTESVETLSYGYPRAAASEVPAPEPAGGPVVAQAAVLAAFPPPADPPPADPPPAASPAAPPPAVLPPASPPPAVPPQADPPPAVLPPASPPPASPPQADPPPAADPSPVVPPPANPPPLDLRSARLEVDEAAVVGGNGGGLPPSAATASAQVWSGASGGTLTSVRIGEAGEFTPVPVPVHGTVSIGFDHDGNPLSPDSHQPPAARLDVDSTGNYTFTVLTGLNHEPGQGNNQLILPHVVHLLGSDSQGTNTVVDLSLVLRDDVPVLLSSGQTEVVRLDEHDLLARPGEALVLHGDVRGQASWGADGFGRVTAVSWSGGSAAIPSDAASVTVYFDSHGQVQAGPDGAAASLLVQDDGGYTFTLDHSLLVAGADRNIVHLLGDGLSLSAQDGDGDLVPGIRVRVEIADDIPSVSAGPVVVGGVALTTHDALTAGAASDSATADFAAAFAAAVQADHGADGAGAVELGGWALQLGQSGTGLSSGGQALSLSQDAGGDIVGSTTAGEVFRLSVDGGGRVTLMQYEALEHGVPGRAGDASVGLGAGLLRLGATATVSDADGDRATVALGTDLGSLIHFDDALPTAQLRSPAGQGDTGGSKDRALDFPPHFLGLDESPPDDPGTAVLDGNGWPSTSEDFSVYFHSDRGRGYNDATSDAVDWGADGRGDIRFSLGLISHDTAGTTSAVDGVSSGIYALAPGGMGQGPEIMLYRVSDTTIQGRVGTEPYFTVSVDASTGVVEFARDGHAVWNPVAGESDDRAVLLGADAVQTTGGHSLVLTQTVSDADGSTRSVSLNLAGYGAADLLAPDLFSIADDAPVAADLQLMLGGAGSVERHIGAEIGADGGLIQSVTVDGASYDWLGASTGNAGSWDAGTKTWEIHTSGGATLRLDMDGDLGNPQDHGWFRYSTPVDAGQTETFDYTLVDGDGDTSSATLTVFVGTDALFGGAQAELLAADDGSRTLYGGGGDDTLLGGAGADSLYGGSGSDVLSGGAGDDLIDGGSNPRLSFSNAYTGGDTASYADVVVVSGTEGVTVSLAMTGPQDTRAAGTDTLVGIEHLLGSAYDDVLTGDGGRNRLAGGAGNDSLFGGAGSDTLSGGAGADVLYGEGDGDSLLGGDGDDLLDGGAGDDTLAGNAGADTLYGGDGNDSLFGGDGSDLLDGGAGDDTLGGDAGADTLHGGSGDDLLIGGAGDDVLDGGANGAGGDTASYSDAAPGPGRTGVTVSLALSGPQDTGTAGRDTLVGIENLVGSDYDDVLSGNDGNNHLSGGVGNDTLIGGAGDDWLEGKVGADVLYGAAGNDTLDGGRGNDTLAGGAGDDVLSGGAGDDLIDGGDNGAAGDTASYDADTLTQGVTVSLALAGSQDTGSRGMDTLVNIENLTGSSLDDALSGNGGDNRLNGLSGDDTLSGGAGSDTLVGGSGADVFVWRLADRGASTDHIVDFNVGERDVLDLRELLDGEHGGAAGFNLEQYLRFDTAGSALALAIDHDGGADFVAQQSIVIDNFADRQALAAALGTADDDMAIIRQMISGGGLKTDS